MSFSVQQPVVAKTDTPAIWTSPPNGYYQEIFNKNRDVYELAVATLVYQILDIQRTAFATRTGQGGLGSKEEIKDCIPHLTGLVGRIIREKYQKGLTREDFQRMYKNLIDPQTEFTSANNFVMNLFSSALFPFIAWYNNSRRAADPRWESSNWYKQAGSWNIVRDVASIVPAFELYRSFTPIADSKSTSALIP